jgi:hypothetical protein
MSIQSNLVIFQGEDVTLNFQMTPAQDISGWTLSGTVKPYLGGSASFTFTPTVVDGGRGQFRASWPRGNTSGLSPGDFVWDVRRTDSGANTVLAHGQLRVKQPVTS